MNETRWYNAIWEMLASGAEIDQLKDEALMINFESLIDEVKEDFDNESE